MHSNKIEMVLIVNEPEVTLDPENLAKSTLRRVKFASGGKENRRFLASADTFPRTQFSRLIKPVRESKLSNLPWA
jgi:hypothetical protein